MGPGTTGTDAEAEADGIAETTTEADTEAEAGTEALRWFDVIELISSEEKETEVADVDGETVAD